MKTILQNKIWLHYVIGVTTTTILFLLRDTNVRTVGLAGRYGLSSITLFLAIAVSFALTLHLALHRKRFRWVYPVLITIYAHFILPITAFLAHYRNIHGDAEFYFMYYLVLGFIYVFLPFLFVMLLAMILGIIWQRKRRKAQEQQVAS